MANTSITDIIDINVQAGTINADALVSTVSRVLLDALSKVSDATINPDIKVDPKVDLSGVKEKVSAALQSITDSGIKSGSVDKMVTRLQGLLHALEALGAAGSSISSLKKLQEALNAEYNKPIKDNTVQLRAEQAEVAKLKKQYDTLVNARRLLGTSAGRPVAQDHTEQETFAQVRLSQARSKVAERQQRIAQLRDRARPDLSYVSDAQTEADAAARERQDQAKANVKRRRQEAADQAKQAKQEQTAAAAAQLALSRKDEVITQAQSKIDRTFATRGATLQPLPTAEIVSSKDAARLKDTAAFLKEMLVAQKGLTEAFSRDTRFGQFSAEVQKSAQAERVLLSELGLVRTRIDEVTDAERKREKAISASQQAADKAKAAAQLALSRKDEVITQAQSKIDRTFATRGATLQPLPTEEIVSSKDAARLKDTAAFLKEMLVAQKGLTEAFSRDTRFGQFSAEVQKSTQAERALLSELGLVRTRIDEVTDAERKSEKAISASQQATDKATKSLAYYEQGKRALQEANHEPLAIPKEHRDAAKFAADTDLGKLRGDLKSGVVTSTADIARYGAEINKLSGISNTLGQELKGNVGAFHDISVAIRQFFRYAVLYGSGYQLLQGFQALGSAVLDLDEKLKTIQSVAQATRDQMLSVGSAIQSTASATKFSVSEIADATLTLAQAGTSVERLPAVLDSVAKFAQATSSSLTVSADIFSSVLDVFTQFRGAETQVADQLTSAINQSKLTGEDLKTITSLGLQTAKTYGLTLKQFLAEAAVLSNAGLKASTIATGGRQTLKDILSPNDRLVGALIPLYQKVGTAAGEATVSAIRDKFVAFQKADNPLLAALREYQRLGAGQGAQRTNITRFMDAQGANAFNALIDSIPELEQTVAVSGLSGAAAQGASTQMESVNNSFRRVQSSAVELASTITSAALPGLAALGNSISGFIQNLQKGVLNLKADGGRGAGAALASGAAVGLATASAVKGNPFLRGAAGLVAGGATVATELTGQASDNEQVAKATSFATTAVSAVSTAMLLFGKQFMAFVRPVLGMAKTVAEVGKAAVTVAETVGPIAAATPWGRIALVIASVLSTLAGLYETFSGPDLKTRITGLRERALKGRAEAESQAKQYEPYSLDSQEGSGAAARKLLKDARPGNLESASNQALAIRKGTTTQVSQAYDDVNSKSKSPEEVKLAETIVKASKELEDPRFLSDDYLKTVEGVQAFAKANAKYVEAISKAKPEVASADLLAVEEELRAATAAGNVSLISTDLPAVMAKLREAAAAGAVEQIQAVIDALEVANKGAIQDVGSTPGNYKFDAKGKLLPPKREFVPAGPEVQSALYQAKEILPQAEKAKTAKANAEAKRQALIEAVGAASNDTVADSPEQARAKASDTADVASERVDLNKRETELARISGDYQKIAQLLEERVTLLQEQNLALKGKDTAHGKTDAQVQEGFSLRARENEASITADRKKNQGEAAKKQVDLFSTRLDTNKTKLEVAKNAENYAEVNRLIQEQFGIQEALNRATRASEVASGKSSEQAEAEYQLRRQQNEAQQQRLLQEKGSAKTLAKIDKEQQKYAKQLQTLDERRTAAQQTAVDKDHKLQEVKTSSREDALAFQKARRAVGTDINATPPERLNESLRAAQETLKADPKGAKDESNRLRDEIVAATKSGDIGGFDASSLLKAAEDINTKANAALEARAQEEKARADEHFNSVVDATNKVTEQLIALNEKAKALTESTSKPDQAKADAEASKLVGAAPAPAADVSAPAQPLPPAEVATLATAASEAALAAGTSEPVQGQRGAAPAGAAVPQGEFPAGYTGPDIGEKGKGSVSTLGNGGFGPVGSGYYPNAETITQQLLKVQDPAAFNTAPVQALNRAKAASTVPPSDSRQAAGTPVNLYLGGEELPMLADPDVADTLQRIIAKQALKQGTRGT